MKAYDATNGNVDSLINEVNGRENFDEISIASVPKFKGGAEEIFEDYADSVVLVGNRADYTTGSGFFINTTSGAVTITLPSSPSAGDIIAIADYAGTFQTNNVTS